jgi:hypothetical protein
VDIYTATSLQPLYKYPRTACTSNTSLVGLIETATIIAGMLLYCSLSLLRTNSSGSNSSPFFLFLALIGNRCSSHRITSRTAQVIYPA